ncbi:MAG: hypothetical protein PVI80_19735 [Anaerolineae bacterium]|jgi:hypothetical protein
MAMTCFTNWYYIPAGGYAKAKGLLTYLQYRDDRDTHIPGAGGPDRWTDCGLGRGWREILSSATELENRKTNTLLRSLVIRPPQEQIADLEHVDPDRWSDRRELMHELVERVMDAERERRGIQWPGGTQPMDLPYSYVLHAPNDKNGVESLHAHVIVPAMDRDGERAFNVYPQDVQHTRQVAERETERLFELERVRERQPELEKAQELQPDMELEGLALEIPFHDFHGR